MFKIVKDIEKKYREHDTEQFKELIILELEPYLKKKIKNYTVPSMETEDLMQVANMAVMEAIDYFNPEKGQLLSFILNVVDKRLKTQLTHANRDKRIADKNCCSLDAPVDFSDNQSRTHLDLLPARDIPLEEYLLQKEEMQRIQQLFEEILTEKERNITLMKLRGYKEKEMSEQLGVSRKSVDNSWQRAKKKLKAYFLNSNQKTS